MEYLKALGVALSSVAVVSLIISYLSKTLIENWLKIRFKESELKTANEFAQFQAALDAFNARNQTVLNNLQPERVKAALDLFPLCMDAVAKIGNALGAQSLLWDVDTADAKMHIRNAKIEAEDKLKLFLVKYNHRLPLFGSQITAVIEELQTYSHSLLNSIHIDSDNDGWLELTDKLTSKRNSFLRELQKLLGVD